MSNLNFLVPKSEDKQLKGALYNTGAIVFVALLGAAATTVYFILQAFIRPLLWAVVFGTFLYPIKTTLTGFFRKRFHHTTSSDAVFTYTLVCAPFRLLDAISEIIGSLVFWNLKLVVAVCICFPILYLITAYSWHVFLIESLLSAFNFCSSWITIIFTKWIWSLIIAHIIIVCCWGGTGSGSNSVVLSGISVILWVAAVFNLVGAPYYLRLPCLIVIISLLTLGYIRQTRLDDRDESNDEEENDSKECEDEADNVDNEDENKGSPAKKSASATCSSHRHKPKLRRFSSLSPHQLKDMLFHSPYDKANSIPKTAPGELSLSQQCFVALFCLFVLVRVWVNLWILQLLPPLLILFIVKRAGAWVGLWQWLDGQFKIVKDFCTEALSSKRDLLLPTPIRGAIGLLYYFDRKVLLNIDRSLDKLMSVLIILSFLFLVIFGGVFSVLQVHREMAHLVSITSSVLNESLHPEISRFVPDGVKVQDTVDTMVNNAYLYGRDYLVGRIDFLIDGSDDQKDKIQAQLLDIIDQLYNSWFAKNSTMITTTTVSNVSATERFWEVISGYDAFRIQDLTVVIQQNIGTLQSILQSVWIVLQSNINLLTTIISASLSIVFSGGTAILNFIISAIIFITTLLYLLVLSDDQYLPVRWIIDLIPSSSTGFQFGSAVDHAIGGVLLAALKMSVFYGVYTWILHTIFSMTMVFIPSALAALFAAIPLLGSYWAALPAIVELWVVQGRPIMAALFLLLSMLPTYVVDTAIYSEIGGGHPYLTGLSIAGGLYCYGLEGALIGPMVLCCLVVCVNVYSDVLKSTETSLPAPASRSRSEE